MVNNTFFSLFDGDEKSDLGFGWFHEDGIRALEQEVGSIRSGKIITLILGIKAFTRFD